MTMSSLPSLHQTFSVLPDNRSPLERALERSFSEQLFSIALPQPDLFNADQIPDYLLPYLGAENLVTDWSADDVEIQRKAAKNQPLVYRQAGTRAGIALALDSAGYDSQVIPWHEMSPIGEPYHFEVIGWKQKNLPVDPDAVNRLIENVNQAKSERDTCEIILAFGVESGIGFSGVYQPGWSYAERELVGQTQMNPALYSSLALLGSATSYVLSEVSAPSTYQINHCRFSPTVLGLIQHFSVSDINLGAST